MNRLKQVILVITFLAFSWLAMQAVHELGHVLGTLLTGGSPNKVYLHPLIISATAVFPNPHPVIVIWSGAIFGTLIPLGAAYLAQALKWPGVYLYRFFAGFCAIMNGIYIGAGPFFPIGDTESLRAYGCPFWTMFLLGLPSLMLGLYLWNNQGPHFGLGKAKGQVDTGATITSSCLLFALVVAELVTSAW